MYATYKDKEETATEFHRWLRLVDLKSNSDKGEVWVFEVAEEFIEIFRDTYGFNCAPD